MRTFDQPLPTVGGTRPPTGWQTNLFITLGRLPVVTYQWDDLQAHWDDPAFEWDEGEWPFDRIDVTCDWMGLEITVGTNDPEGILEAAEANLTLSNRSGEYAQYDVNGHLAGYGPGTPLDVWAIADGQPWWLFRGRVVRWQEQPNRTVEIQAFDRFSDFNEDPGVEWIPGLRGDTPGVRIGTILDIDGYPEADYPRRLDAGAVTLHAHPTEASPLEEMQQVAISDGGIFGVDVDGTIYYRDRDWRGGRDDQDEVRVYSDNVCEGATVVWEPVILTDDELIVNIATLTNLPEIPLTEEEEEPPPITVYARNERSVNAYGPQTANHPDEHQWLTAAEGQALADYIVANRSNGYLRIESFALYLHTGLWRHGIDLRIGDLVRFIRDQPAQAGLAARVDLLLIVAQVHHNVTPNGWITTLGTTRTVSNFVTYHWDSSVSWDATPPFMWDGQQPQPA
jgi:hypothetical protein